MTSRFSEKYSITLVIVSLIVITSMAIWSFYTWQNAKAVKEQGAESELRLSLLNLSQNIDARIAKMQLIAKTVANDTHIHAWIDAGAPEEQAKILIDKLGFLVDEYKLTSASFADKNTHRYWNHEGFLRVLTPEIDRWYFAYLASTEQDLVSVYHDKNKHRVDLYVNYQQTDGNGLSGVATSFDGVVELLNTSWLATKGDVFMVDSHGLIQVHPDPDMVGKVSLQQRYAGLDVSNLLTLSTNINKALVESHQISVSYIPSMNWYLVVVL